MRWGSARPWNLASRYFESQNPVDICDISGYCSQSVHRLPLNYFTKLFHHAYPGVSNSWEPMASVTNTTFAHLTFVSGRVRSVHGDEI